MPEQPPRIIVEVASPEVIKRLEAENETLRQQVKLLEERHNALHATVYQLLNRFADLKRSAKDR